MKMDPIGSYTRMLSHQGVKLFGNDSYIYMDGVALVKEVCR